MKNSNEEEEEEEEEEKGGFHSPRPSLFTQAQQPLVRPSTLSRQIAEKVEGGKSNEAEPSSRRSLAEPEKGAGRSSMTSRLLSLVPSKRSSVISKTIIRKGVAEETSVNDTLDSTLGRLALGGGERATAAAAGPGSLRRPKLK